MRKIYSESINKYVGIKWWVRLLLYFKKPYYSYDFGSDELTILVFKQLFGKVYVIKSL